MIPSFSLFLGRSSQKQHVGVFTGSAIKPIPHLGVSLLFEDIRTKHSESTNPESTSPNTALTTNHHNSTNSNSSQHATASYKMDEDQSANRTFAIVKPDALTPFKYQQIDALIKLNEFTITRQKLIWLTKELALTLFPEKASDSDNEEWLDYITSAPSLAMELSKVNAPLFWQITMGAEDPSDAGGNDSDSIRGILAVDRIRNAVDGSQEPEDAAKHLALIFSDDVLELPYDNFLMERAEDAHSTLAIIKPDISGNDAAVLQIIKRIVSRGYNIKDRIDITLSQNQAKAFYAEHAAKPFFDDLVAFMTSGPIIALLLEGDDVIRGWRMMIGSIDPDTARKDVPQSIRALLGASSPRNAVHGSDSVQSAQRELFFFFSPRIQPEEDSNNIGGTPDANTISSITLKQQTTPNDDVLADTTENPAAVVVTKPNGDDKKKKKQKKRRNKRKQAVTTSGPNATDTSNNATVLASDESEDEPSVTATAAEQVETALAEAEAPAALASEKKADNKENDRKQSSNGTLEAEQIVEAPAADEDPLVEVNESDSTDSVVVELAIPADPANERTFALIKPDAYPRYRKQLVKHIIEKGLTVVAQEEVVLTREAAMRIYDSMSMFPVFQRVVDFVTSGSVLALVLEGPDAVSVWRNLVGPNHPKTAKFEVPNSLRAKYGKDAQMNAVHASKDLQEAQKSIKCVFYELLNGNFSVLHPTDDPLAVVLPAERAVQSESLEKDTIEELVDANQMEQGQKSAGVDSSIGVDGNAVFNVAEHGPEPEKAIAVDKSVVQQTNTDLYGKMEALSVAVPEPGTTSLEMQAPESSTIDTETVVQDDKADNPAADNIDKEKIAHSESSPSISPQTKSTPTLEKQSALGNRLASSPFLKADRQLTQEQPLGSKRVGRIKSPFLGNERSEPAIVSSSPSPASKSTRTSPLINGAAVDSDNVDGTEPAQAQLGDKMAGLCIDPGMQVDESHVENDGQTDTEAAELASESKTEPLLEEMPSTQDVTTTETDKKTESSEISKQDQPTPKDSSTSGDAKQPQRQSATRPLAKSASKAPAASTAAQRVDRRTSATVPAVAAIGSRRTTLGALAAGTRPTKAMPATSNVQTGSAASTRVTKTTTPIAARPGPSPSTKVTLESRSTPTKTVNSSTTTTPSRTTGTATTARTTPTLARSSATAAKSSPSARPASATVTPTRQPTTSTVSRPRVVGSTAPKAAVKSLSSPAAGTTNTATATRTASTARIPAAAKPTSATAPAVAARVRSTPISTATPATARRIATKAAPTMPTAAKPTASRTLLSKTPAPVAASTTTKRAVAQSSASSSSSSATRTRTTPVRSAAAAAATPAGTTTPPRPVAKPTLSGIKVSSTAASRARAAAAAAAKESDSAKAADSTRATASRTATRTVPRTASSAGTVSKPVAAPSAPNSTRTTAARAAGLGTAPKTSSTARLARVPSTAAKAASKAEVTPKKDATAAAGSAEERSAQDEKPMAAANVGEATEEVDVVDSRQ